MRVADTLDKWMQAERPIFYAKLDLQIAKSMRKIVEARPKDAMRAESQKLRAADCHLRRSALQFSKAIKSTDIWLYGAAMVIFTKRTQFNAGMSRACYFPTLSPPLTKRRNSLVRRERPNIKT
jgi:hypothetical protein